MYTYQEVYNASVGYFNGDELAAKVFVDKYALSDTNGKYFELTPEDMHRRLAKEFARIENKYPNPMSEDEIFSLFKDFKYVVPQGSPMAGIGNPHQLLSLSNCYVIDSPQDSYAGIMHTDQESAQIYKRRGGIGFDLSKIRPKGLAVNNAAKSTEGVIPFMERFSNTTREVALHGRRGALMLTISVHHPQIKDFLTVKNNLDKVTGANISVRFSDEFMNAVKTNSEYEQRWPIDSNKPEILNSVRARDIWDLFCKSAWQSAEPGALFWDTVKRNTPADIYKDFGFESISTNPSLRGNTLVLTSEGVFSIKELYENNDAPKLLNIKGEWVDAKVMLSSENEQLVKITFANNQVVFASKEHKWPIFDKDIESNKLNSLNCTKKKSTELQAGDKLPLVFYDKPIDNKNCNFTREDGFVLGWNLGDGWISWHKIQNRTQYGFEFSHEDVDSGIGEKVLNYTNKYANRPSTLRKDHDCKAYTYVTTDLNVHKQMSQLGAINKVNGIPKTIWTGNHEFICGFIDGLFSSDGGVSKTFNDSSLGEASINLTTSKENIASDVVKLLSFYGIKATCTKSIIKNAKFPNGKDYNKEYTRFMVEISGKCAKHFAKTFKLSNVNKSEKLNKFLTLNYKNNKTNNDFIKIKSVELTNEYDKVYDITVLDDTNTFVIENTVTR